MKKALMLSLVCLAFGTVGSARAGGWRKNNSELTVLNAHLRGKVIDHTANHGQDLRIWSRSMAQRRDLYVYLPPNFDPHERYPLILFLHGYSQDEQSFLEVVKWLDQAIFECKLPPVIAAAPDGSEGGEPSSHQAGSFFLNSNVGDFEDLVINDVWDFLASHYPIRPEREAHVLAGISMGGFAAFNLGIRYRGCFGVAIGIHPPLNLRWVDVEGNYNVNFDPYRWGWRTKAPRHHEVAGFFGGVIPVHMQMFIDPLFGKGDNALVQVSCNNPIELIDRTKLRNGQLQMYVAYGGHDELNIDAQVESFLYLAKFRQLSVGVGYDPSGRHDMKTAYRLFPDIVTWLAPRIAPYAPGACKFVCEPMIPSEPYMVSKISPPVAREAGAAAIRGSDRSGGDRYWEPAPPPRQPAPPPDRKDLGPYAGPPVDAGPYSR